MDGWKELLHQEDNTSLAWIVQGAAGSPSSGDFRNCLESCGSPDPFLSPTGSDEASALRAGVDVLSEFQELSIIVFLSYQCPPNFWLRNRPRQTHGRAFMKPEIPFPINFDS